MNKERELLRRAKNNLAKLCSVNSMSSRGEMLRLIDEAIKGIDEFLASEPERKPMTVEEIRKLGESFRNNRNPEKFIDFARAIEKHHGIGEEE